MRLESPGCLGPTLALADLRTRRCPCAAIPGSQGGRGHRVFLACLDGAAQRCHVSTTLRLAYDQLVRQGDCQLQLHALRGRTEAGQPTLRGSGVWTGPFSTLPSLQCAKVLRHGFLHASFHAKCTRNITSPRPSKSQQRL